MRAPAGAGRARSSGLSAGAGGLLGTTRRETAAALRLLTRFPLPSHDPADASATAASGAIAFPLVGAVVGLIGTAPLVLVGWLQPLSSLLAMAVIAVVTGALHLDGLADTTDALLAPDRERAERARKDPAVGPGGAVALVLVVAIEASALAAVATAAGAASAAGALLIAAIVSRTVAVVTTALERSRAAPDGFGAWFAARVRPGVALGAAIIAGLIGAAIAVLLGTVGIGIGGVVGAVVGMAIGVVIVRWRRQLDGDALGAVVELTVAAVLVATAIVVTAPVA
jgi:adenosylcobinamide-GDP ribazoletransferase